MQLPFGKAKNTRPEDGGQDAPTEAKKPGFWKSIDWKLMLALFFPVTLETLDYTVVATAQSHIASVFNALPLESYIGTSYLLASTVFLPLFASIADIYGRHFGLQLSLLFFLLGSTLGTGAQNMGMILAGRGISGIGAAGLLTIVRTVISDTGSLNENNIQQSMMFLLYSVGFSVGPVIGGYLVSANFRWVFAINLPCTLLAMLMCFIFLRNRSRAPGPGDEEEPMARGPRRTLGDTMDDWVSKLELIDWVGTLLFVSGGVLVLLALNWGPDDNWKTARVIATLVLGVILLVLCLVWEVILERRSPSTLSDGSDKPGYVKTKYSGVFRAHPMIPIEMFTSYDMCVVQYGAYISGIVMFVMFYFVALFATVVTGLPPGQAGVQLLYFAPGLGGGSLLSIRVIKWLRQPIYPIVLGSAIMTIGVGLIQMAMQQNNQGQVNGFMAMAGVGVGLSAGPEVIQARFVKPNHVAVTNAMMLFFRAFGGTVGLAQCFTILNAKVNAYIHGQVQSLETTLSPSDLATLVALLNSGGLASVTSLDGFSSAVQDVIREAFRDGVRWAFVSLVPWLGIGTIVSVFLSKINDSDEGGEVEPAETHVAEVVEMRPREIDRDAAEPGADVSAK